MPPRIVLQNVGMGGGSDGEEENGMSYKWTCSELCETAQDAARLRAENERLRAFYDAWVECEVAMATSNPDLARQKRTDLFNAYKAIRGSTNLPTTTQTVEDACECDHDWETVNPGVMNSQRCMRCGLWR